MHRFGGIGIDADFETDQLRATGVGSERFSLAVRRTAEPPHGETVIHRSDGRYRLSCGQHDGNWVFRSRFSDTFIFKPAEHGIDYHVLSTVDQAWQDVLFRRVLPRVATKYGAIAMHAAAIAKDDRCLLLLGHSGAGKSTMTTLCAMTGWSVLSDDTSLLWMDDEPVVEPVQRGMSVWNDVRDALSLPPANCRQMPGYDGRKWCFRPAEPHVVRAQSLSGIIILDRSTHVDTPRIVRLMRNDVLPVLRAQNIPFLSGGQPDASTATTFGRIAALSRLPSFRLTYPHGYAALPRVEALLRDMPLAGDA